MAYRHAMVLVVLASVVALAVSVGQADVFNMPNGQASLQFVTVGNPGNVADTYADSGVQGGCGAVGYVYQMGTYDVTVGQYVQFLNAVAKTDTYGLYTTSSDTGQSMATEYPTVGIVRSGRPGSYTYSVSYSASAWSSYSANFPSLYPSAMAAAADCPIFDFQWNETAFIRTPPLRVLRGGFW